MIVDKIYHQEAHNRQNLYFREIVSVLVDKFCR